MNEMVFIVRAEDDGGFNISLKLVPFSPDPIFSGPRKQRHPQILADFRRFFLVNRFRRWRVGGATTRQRTSPDKWDLTTPAHGVARGRWPKANRRARRAGASESKHVPPWGLQARFLGGMRSMTPTTISMSQGLQARFLGGMRSVASHFFREAGRGLLSARRVRFRPVGTTEGERILALLAQKPNFFAVALPRQVDDFSPRQ